MRLALFDLENTLVEHWTEQTFCWVDSNRDILSEIKPDIVGVFSFALYDEDRITEFNGGLRSRIETVYGIQISDEFIVPVDEMLMSEYRYRKLEKGDNNQKLYTFMDWCYSNTDRLSEFSEVWLVDDSVTDCDINEFPFEVHCRNPVVIRSFI